MDTKHHFGPYGGQFVPEMLIPILDELEKAFIASKNDKDFNNELNDLYRNYSGRPTPLTFARRLTKDLGGAQIYLKNEGLNHTGAHKINHCLGQILLAKRMGKTRIIAETGAGQHGVATATVAAKFGLECTIYMGAKDISRQRPNVFYMEKLGAKVISVNTGSKTLKDAVNMALKDLITNPSDTHYLIGSVLGPAPYPEMNKYFQSIIGIEVKRQIQDQSGKMPDVLIACVGGGSNALGLFSPFIGNSLINCIGVEAGGFGNKLGQHAARFRQGKTGILHGYKSYVLQDNDGNIASTSSISAGLDYPALGPELAQHHDSGRITFTTASDKAVLHAFEMLAKTEGIIPALESAHAIAEVIRLAPSLSSKEIIVVNISGRGDKDIFTLAKSMKDIAFHSYIKEEAKNEY